MSVRGVARYLVIAQDTVTRMLIEAGARRAPLKRGRLADGCFVALGVCQPGVAAVAVRLGYVPRNCQLAVVAAVVLQLPSLSQSGR